MGSRRWLDMSSRPRFQRLSCRCLRRRAYTLLGAPYSLPDTDRSSLLHRRCLQTMSCPLDNSRMLPLPWLQVPLSICRRRTRCSCSLLSYPESQCTFPPDTPRTMLLKRPQ